MGKTYVIDFETYWSNTYTLSRMGPIEYVRDQRFKPQLLAAMRIENQYEMPKGLVTDNIENMRAFLQRADESSEDPIILAGHNMAGFDALVVSEYFGIRPVFIVDTITMMNWIGYSRLGSRSHAALCELLDTGRKKAGTVVSCGKQWPQEFTPEEQQFFIQYCHDDAEQCAFNLLAMMPHMSSDALLFGDITARMATRPVFELDEKLLEEYIAEIDAKVEQTRQELLSIFHFSNEGAFLQAIRSAAKFAVMLTSLGVEPPTKVSEAKTKTKKAQLELLMQQARSVEEQMEIQKRMDTELPVMTYAFSKTDLDFLALREHPDMRVQMLVNARLDHNTSIDRSRAERLLFFARQHKPIPIMLSAFNAHTGRYTAGAADEGGASDKLQFQNLSKRDPNKAKLRQAIKAPAGYKVVACDSGQVEARCLAWEANETRLVAQFREGRDPYSELAETVFQVPHEQIFYGAKHGDKKLKMYRNVGKTAILSAGYGVGARKFSDTLSRQGAKLDPDPDKHREMAFNAHAIYRASHPNIVKFWDLCGNVIRNMEAGYSGKFGGPNGDLFEFGTKEMGSSGRKVPYVLLPNGYHLWYPNLRIENEDGKVQYFYDRPRGKNLVKTKIYGGSLCENCIARGSLILTDSGWKPIETITLNDKVYDGVDFVTHSGVVSKGVQDCIQVDGIWMTPDHKLLTEDGWQYAKETNVCRLRRCSLRGTLGEGTYPPQLQGHNRAKVWATRCREALVFCQRKMGLALSVRLWRGSRTQNSGCVERFEAGFCPSLPGMCSEKCIRATSYTWDVTRPAICSVALHETSVLLPNVSCLSSLWGAWHNCVRQVEGFVRELFSRYGTNVSAWFGIGQNKQRRELLPGELPLDNIQGKLPEQERCLQRNRCGHFEPSIRHRQDDFVLPHQSWLASGETAGPTRLRQLPQGSAGQHETGRTQAEVYDILNCGRRQSFVVKGISGPVIAHNCTQAFAFAVLAWQACRMREAGLQLAANIHDSFAVVVPEDKAEETGQLMYKIMTTCPPWASTLPLFAETEIGDSFLVV